MKKIREILPFFISVTGISFWMLFFGSSMKSSHVHGNNLEEWPSVTHEKYGFSIKYPPNSQVWLYGDSGYRGRDSLKLGIGQSLAQGFLLTIHQYEVEEPTDADAKRISDRILFRNGRTSLDVKTVDSIFEREDGEVVFRRSIEVLDNYRGEKACILRPEDIICIEFTQPIYQSDGAYHHYIEDLNLILESFQSTN